MEDSAEVRITLRLPAGLRDTLLEAAASSSRSMNGEIVHRLDKYDAVMRDAEHLAATLERREQELFSERVLARKARHKSDLVAARAKSLEKQLSERDFDLRQTQNEVVALKERLLKIGILSDDELISRVADAVAQRLRS